MVLEKRLLDNSTDILLKSNLVWRIIILSSLQEPKEVELQELKDLVRSENVEWEYFFEILKEHKIQPIIVNNLIKYVKNELPETIREDLIKKMKTATFFYFSKVKQLKECISFFKENNIDVIPWKGIVLSEEIYGSFNLRQSSDIDIIVRKKDLFKAKNLMLNKGYLPLWKMDDKQEQLYIRDRHSYELIKPNHVDVEIHWRLAKKQYLLNISMDDFWFNSSSKNLYDIEVKYPSKEYLLVGLAIHHGGVECWLKYKLIVDWYYLLKKHPDMDWQKVLDIANKLGLRRIVLVGLSLCNRLFNVEIPELLKPFIKKEEIKLTETILKNLLNNDLVKQSSLLIKMRENRYHRVLIFVKILTTPSLIDSYFNSKDNYLLLVLIRPFRLIRKFILGEDDNIEYNYSNRNNI